jgi:type I restriction enzyme M protein
MTILLRKDLKDPGNLKEIFKDIRNHLAGNFKGMTRDSQLVEQVIFLLLCKIQDEKNTSKNDPTVFQLDLPEESLTDRLNRLFTSLKTQFGDILQSGDKLVIDEPNLQYIVRKLQIYEISKASRDAIGDAFEQVMLPSLRGSQGQFFTPKNIVTTIIDILNPSKEDLILDPACGTGGFLTNVLLRKENLTLDAKLFGIDKDAFLVKISQLYLALLDSSNSKVFCENSLEIPDKWNPETQKNISFDSFDIIMTNPPFGVKIPIKDQELLKTYDLGHKWLIDLESNEWIKTSHLHERQPPQILFIERCLRLLKKGGKMGIVLPEGIFGNPRDRYIVDYLLKNYKILAIISCGHLAYMPHTHIKTSLLFVEKIAPPSNSYPIFVAVADKVGHDKNGKELYKINGAGTVLTDEMENKVIDDDFPTVVKNFRLFKSGKQLSFSLRGFILNRNEIHDNILIPKYYNPEIKQDLSSYRKRGYQLISIKELVDKNVLSIQRGHEVGAKFYGTGNIPFVRTSDLINLEINAEPLKQVAEEVYLQYKERQDIQAGDILIVNDGTYLIGRTAFVTKDDKQIVIQSHLKKIRVLKNDILNEYLLLWALNTPVVIMQIRAKTFVQATISTLGDRLLEVILVIPSDILEKERISKEFQTIINQKQQLKAQYRNLIKLS